MNMLKNLRKGCNSAKNHLIAASRQYALAHLTVLLYTKFKLSGTETVEGVYRHQQV